MKFLKTLFGIGPDPRAAMIPLYISVVAEARQPAWYAEMGVPDTLDGRFDMIAAVLSLVFAVARGRLDRASFWLGLRETATATAMIYFMIIGATVFTSFVTLVRIPEALIALISQLNLSPLSIIFVLLLTYLVLGAVFDEISAMLITLPFVLPIVIKLGYDPVWWGILNVVIIELGMIIPPIGLIVFIMYGMRPDIPLATIYRGVTPFIIADLVLLALLTIFPRLTTLLL